MVGRSKNHLQINNKSVVVFGVLFLVMGSVMAFLFLTTTEIRCDRSAGECVVSTDRLVGTSSQEVVPLDQVREATVSRSRSSSDSGGYVYRAMLQTYQGELALAPFSSSSRHVHQDIANSINEFLDDSDRELVTADFGSGWAALILVFPVFGLFMLGGTRNVVEASVDSNRGVLNLVRRRWWQKAGKLDTIPLSDIERVDVETKEGSGSRAGRRGRSRRSKPTHRAVIVRKSGASVPLFGFSSSGNGAFKRADQLRALLNPHLEGPA